MSKENESVFRRWIEDVWHKGKENTIEELFDENGIAEYQFYKADNPIHGINRFKEFVRMMRQMFTDISVNIEQIVTDENRVIAVCHVTAKRRSSELGGLITHKSIKASGLCQMIIENGKIIRTWNNINFFGNDDSTESFISKTV